MLKSKSVRCSNGYVTRTAVCAFHDLFLSRYHNPFQSFSNESNPSNNSNNLGSENLKDKASDAGYKSIGSFHGDNIEHRMSLSDEEYENFVPELPFDSKIEQIVSSNNPNVNRTLCWNDAFLLDRETWTFLNHGAFGAALSCGHIRANQWRDFQEEQPLRFFDRHLLPHLAHSNRVLAKFTGSKSPESTVLIPNVTSGMNTILSGYARNHVDRPIIFFDVAYGSVKKMISCYCGVENVFEIKLSTLPSPLSQETIEKVFIQSLDKIKSKCKGNVSGGILVLDHITSNTAMLLPVERLAAIAKEEGLLVAVDGAHGLFSVDLNMQHLTESGVDFYVSNTHKWLSCPRGAAFLYCSDKVLQESILRKPAIVSHGINDGFLRYVVNLMISHIRFYPSFNHFPLYFGLMYNFVSVALFGMAVEILVLL